jgi:hypothetical protein
MPNPNISPKLALVHKKDDSNHCDHHLTPRRMVWRRAVDACRSKFSVSRCFSQRCAHHRCANPSCIDWHAARLAHALGFGVKPSLVPW